MKTIILYATKYGASREIARRIAEKLPDSTVCDLKKDSIPTLTQYDCVILGGSVYAGMLRKEVKEFAKLNEAELTGKMLGLFISGMGTEQERIDAGFNLNFPEALLCGAKTKAFLGGIFDPGKAGWFDRFLFKAVAKQSAYSDIISNDKITEFVESMKA